MWPVKRGGWKSQRTLVLLIVPPPPAGNHAPAAPQVAYGPNIANLMELLAKAAADVPPSLTPACCWLTPLRCPAGHYDLWDFLQSFHIRAPTYTPELRTHFTLTTQLHDEIHIHFITHRTLGIVAGTPPHLVAAARSYICHVAAMFLLAGHPDSSKKIGQSVRVRQRNYVHHRLPVHHN